MPGSKETVRTVSKLKLTDVVNLAQDLEAVEEAFAFSIHSGMRTFPLHASGALFADQGLETITQCCVCNWCVFSPQICGG